jgi:hypothetical protein
MPGLPPCPLALGAVAEIDPHEGLPLDMLAALVTAAYVTIAIVVVLVLMHRIPWLRRRMLRRAR